MLLRLLFSQQMGLLTHLLKSLTLWQKMQLERTTLWEIRLPGLRCGYGVRGKV